MIDAKFTLSGKKLLLTYSEAGPWQSYLVRLNLGDTVTSDTLYKTPTNLLVDPIPLDVKISDGGRAFVTVLDNSPNADSTHRYLGEVLDPDGPSPVFVQKALWLGGYKLSITGQYFYGSCFPNTPFDPGVLAGSPCDTLGLAVAPPPKAPRPAFSLFPNPANESVTVSFPLGAKSVLVFNALGSPVLQKPIAGPTTTVSVAGLAPGLYRVVVMLQNHTTTAQNLSVVH